MISPVDTLAILLGGSRWPKSPNLGAPQSFINSATDFLNYLGGPGGLALPGSNILNCFDSDKPPSVILEEIVSFLKKRSSLPSAPSLLLYYVGHGFFNSDEYLLALPTTNSEIVAASSLRVSDLAGAILKNSSGMRRFLILDCCFAAAAYAQFQCAPLQAAVEKLKAEFIPEGTALLCASGAREPAKAPPDEAYTMFSGALLEVLRLGSAAAPEQMSLADVGELTAALIKSKYALEAVRPEVHTPDKRKGDIALVPLFPNPAVSRDMSRRMLSIEKSIAVLTNAVGELQRSVSSLVSIPSSSAQATALGEDPPVFSVLEVHKTLQFISSPRPKKGASTRRGKYPRIALLTRRQKMKANLTATEFLICNISSDGSVRNFKLDGDYSPVLQYETDAGQIDVTAKYSASIPRGKTIDLTLQYELVDAFRRPEEYLGHIVQHETQRVILEILFTDFRKCLSGTVHRRFGGTTHQSAIIPERAESGMRLRAEISSMRIGEEYRLAWRW